MEYIFKNLIKKEESLELYMCQQNILDDLEKHHCVDSYLKLALLQLLSPIEDFFAAEKVLRCGFSLFKNFNLCVIGSYLCSTHCFDVENIYIHYLIKNINELPKKRKAIVIYLSMLSELSNSVKKQDINILLSNLYKCLEYYPDFYNCELQIYRIKHNKSSMEEIDKYYNNCDNSTLKTSIEEQIEPERFIKQFIIRNDNTQW